MRFVVLGASALTMIAASALAPAQAQMAGPENVAEPRQVAPGQFVVFFAFDESELTPDARSVIAQAADSYRQTGAASVTLTGHTDTVGNVEYNQALAQRRADAVQNELVRLGVPLGSIQTIAVGQQELLVPTPDGVREPRNRAVVINVPQPAPAPIAAEPVQQVEAAPPQPEPIPRFKVSLGGLYGYNFDENGEGDEAHLVGGEGSVGFAFTPYTSITFDQGIWNTLESSEDDGWGYRSVAGIDFHGDTRWGGRPYIGLNGGYVWGKGVQDGWVAGPELGFEVDIAGGSFLYGKAAYDYQFEGGWGDWNQGIVTTGLGLGWRF